jgi:uncharacterized membrane protein
MPAPGPSAPRTAAGWTPEERRILAGTVLALFTAWTTYAWARHAKYETTGFDLGIFDQVVRAYAHFHAPTSPLKGVGYNLLGDHFHPILVLLVPLYWVWDDPRVLLLVQAALFAVSAVPVASFARRRFGARPALFMAFAYGASWPIERAVHFDFHEIAFAVPLIALLVEALDRRAYRTIVVCCVLLLLVREDMGALVLLTGLLIAVRGSLAGAGAGARAGRRRELLFGGGLAVLGLLGYWLATSVIIPAFGPDGFAYWTFPALGPDPASAARTILLHPWQVLRLMVTPAVKFHTLVTIFYPTGFLALLSPYTVLAMPFLAERMLNERKFLWETNFHYTSVIAPIVVMGAADTAARLVHWFPRALGTRRPGRLRRFPIGLTVAFVAWSVGVVVFQLAVKAPDYPVSGLWSGRVWARDARWHAVRDVLPLIPAGQCVEADNQVAPQLTSRDYVTRVASRQVPGSNGLATWVVLDLKRADTGWQGDPPRVALAAAQRRGYAVVWQQDSVVLLHKDQPIAALCRGLY